MSWPMKLLAGTSHFPTWLLRPFSRFWHFFLDFVPRSFAVDFLFHQHTKVVCKAFKCRMMLLGSCWASPIFRLFHFTFKWVKYFFIICVIFLINNELVRAYCHLIFNEKYSWCYCMDSVRQVKTGSSIDLRHDQYVK